MQIPEDLKYTDDHEWVRVDGDRLRLGITDYAQDQLGDIVFIELPETGREVAARDVIAEVESTKSVGEVYAPVPGTVVAVNEAVRDRPELVNQDPYGDGWLLELTGGADLGALLDADAYRALIE